MRFSLVASAALAAAPALVQAQGTKGFAIGTKKGDGSCKYQADYEQDLDAISGQADSKIVRTYAASDCNSIQYLLPAAAAKGAQVIAGVWPDTDESYQADKAALQQYVPANPSALYGITVGSETLYRGNFTAAQLLSKIQDMKSAFPNVKVGTADSWNKYADGTADGLLTGSDPKPDMLLVNAFGFWQGQDINNASATYFDDIMQAFNRIQGLSNSVELWNGETGWPTDGGSSYQAATASTANAETFYNNGFCAMLEWGVNAFYFEAFDEPWKPDSIGDDGLPANEQHWGAFDVNRVPKFDLHC